MEIITFLLLTLTFIGCIVVPTRLPRETRLCYETIILYPFDASYKLAYEVFMDAQKIRGSDILHMQESLDPVNFRQRWRDGHYDRWREEPAALLYSLFLTSSLPKTWFWTAIMADCILVLTARPYTPRKNIVVNDQTIRHGGQRSGDRSWSVTARLRLFRSNDDAHT